MMSMGCIVHLSGTGGVRRIEVVNVLYHIFRKMFVNKENEDIQLTLF